MVAGICDNLLLTTYLSAKCPVMIAPAMDLDMYAHPATQENLKKLAALGCQIVEPGTGELASGLFGKGRMEEPEAIVERIRYFFAQNQPTKLTGKKVLITAGPTYEQIDPVRFIGNFSSGKMGYAIAEELALRGAVVKLISGPVQVKAKHPAIEVISVTSAQEMYEACNNFFPQMDGAIMAAAVADYTPTHPTTEKLKRKGESLTIELTPTLDIAAHLGGLKRSGQVLVGFALETNDGKENALKKLQSKNLDFIVLNTMGEQGVGFMVDTNRISIFNKENKWLDFPLKPKNEVAKDIANQLELHL
jgi:phosphopantothenoylcysteine decarboxylase/phosphopantothenate--cysteine ligase